MELPKDDMLLLSLVNTALRDRFPTFERFCKANDADADEIVRRLEGIGYIYDGDMNKFV